MYSLIETENLEKIYNRQRPDEFHALRDITLTIRQGEVVALKGPSGSGKTTLLSLIGCMARPTSGQVRVKDKTVSKLPERFLTEIRRSTFGFIFQQFNLLPDLSVLENVLLPLYPLEVPYAQMRQRALQLLEDMRLQEKQLWKARQLSGGQQQRVAIARALINQPDVLIADEPTAHLDSALTEDLLKIFHRLQQKGKTIIIATHDPRVFEHPLVSQVFEMRDGRIVGNDA